MLNLQTKAEAISPSHEKLFDLFKKGRTVYGLVDGVPSICPDVPRAVAALELIGFTLLPGKSWTANTTAKDTVEFNSHVDMQIRRLEEVREKQLKARAEAMGVSERLALLRMAQRFGEAFPSETVSQIVNLALLQKSAVAKAAKAKFSIGQAVRKKSGSEWEGTIVGVYSTTLTPEGYAVESRYHAGSVQIYPATALEPVK